MKRTVLSIIFGLILFLSFSQTTIDRRHIERVNINRIEEIHRFAILRDTCLIDTSKYNFYIKENIIDTNTFNDMLIRHGIFDDFKNKNFNKIDPQIFEVCMENSIMYKSTELSPPVEEIPPDKGTLTYVIKDTMELNNTYVVDVTLSKGFTEEQLINIIDGFKNKELIDTLIKITPIMKARLLDPANNFKIKSITDSIQNTTNTDLVRWQWQVVPMTEGDNYLTISVDIYIDNVPQSINIYNGKTYVYSIHTWHGDLWNWIEKYWTYITYVIGGVCAIIAWLYKEKIISFFKKNGEEN